MMRGAARARPAAAAAPAEHTVAMTLTGGEQAAAAAGVSGVPGAGAVARAWTHLWA